MGRKLFIIFLLLLILLGGGFFLLWSIGKKSLAEKLLTQAETEPFYLQDQIDSDKDGLKDWEERLWGTDPLVTDSDSDGDADGVEVQTNRHPLKPGPDDSLVGTDEKVDAAISAALRDRAEPLAEPSRQELAQAKTPYQVSQLRVTIDSPVSAQLYASSFKRFLENFQNFQGVNATQLALEYWETHDPAIISQLINMSIFFQQQATELAGAPIPTSASATHLALVNSLQDLAVTITSIANINKEPVLALQSTQVYGTKVVTMINAMKAVDYYLQTQEVKLDE